MKVIVTQTLQKQAANWGRAGSGIMFVCPADQTVILMLRSRQVMDPFMWGIPGGAVKGTEGHFEEGASRKAFNKQRLWDSAIDEANQEVFGHDEHGYGDQEQMPGVPETTKPHGQMVTYDTNPANPSSFKYYTFVVTVSPEEKRRMMSAPRNWESDDMKWFPISQLKDHIKPMQPNTGHPVHPDFGKIHNGVAHALHAHPYFNPSAQPRQRKPAAPSPEQNPTL